MVPGARTGRLLTAVGATLLGAGCAMDVALDAQATGATGGFERTLSVDGAADLWVSTGSGNIIVQAGEPGTVRVVARIRASSRLWSTDSRTPEERVAAVEANPPIEVRGNTVRIGDIPDRDLRRSVSISYELTVPYETTLEARTGSGRQTIGSFRGPVDASTGSGRISVGEIATRAKVSTGSGDIELLGAGEGLDASTGSGSITARKVVGGLRARTGSGDIEAQGVPTSDWRLSSGSGDIRLEVPPSAGFDLRASTSSGSIDTDHPIEVLGRVTRRQLQGKVRGGGPRLEVSTSSGSVRIR